MNPSSASPFELKQQKLGAQFVERAGWRVVEAFKSPQEELSAVRDQVGLMDLTSRGKLVAKGAPVQEAMNQSFDIQLSSPGTMAQVEFKGKQIVLALLTGDECLLLTPPGLEEAVMDLLGTNLGDSFVTCVDQTAGLAGLLLAGPDSRRVLCKLCALSFHFQDFPNFHVAQGSFAKVRTTLLRRDLGALPAFELYFERSYGEYVWDAVMEAGKEFLIQPFGWQSMALLKDASE